MSFETQAARTTFYSSYHFIRSLKRRYSYRIDIENSFYFAAAGAALALKVGYDASWHNDYAINAHDAFKRFVRHIDLYNINSLKDANLYSLKNAMR